MKHVYAFNFSFIQIFEHFQDLLGEVIGHNAMCVGDDLDVMLDLLKKGA
jgi:hypothetical protein